MSSLEERLSEIDRELLTLHQFCVRKGFSPQQIQDGAGPLLNVAKAYRRKQFARIVLKVSLVLMFFGLLFYIDPVQKSAWAGVRIMLIKLLPYWDWTSLHASDCILDNPYYVGPHLETEDCELCESLVTVPDIQNATFSQVSENYLRQDRPFIVTDAMDDWPARKQYTVHFLGQLFNSEESLSKYEPCMYKSNIRIQGGAKALLRTAATGDRTNYYAHWENCHKDGAKFLRGFFRRPYFLPPMVEMSEANWIFVANSYTGKTYKPIDVAHPLIWIGQIKGQMKVSLTPQKPCTDVCKTLYVTLHEGSMLVVTDLMWLVDYLPQGSGEMIAIGGGGFFE